MKKRLKIMFMSFFALGLAIWYARLVLPPILPDFASGFFAGVSTTLLLIGVAYIGWCIGKRENPFSFNV